MSFQNLKNNRKQLIDNLVNEAQKLNESSFANDDDKYWKPTVDKAGNGFAIIRFLPAPEGEDLPWVRYWDHGFKGNTGLWYIEKSLTSIGQQDPVSEMNTKLWNSGHDEDKSIARDRKRRLNYVSNIYVISDSSAPQNEGKVFLYKYGKKIFDKIMDVMQPQFEDETPVNPFDFWEGANFKMKIRNVEGYRNYDKSEFDSSTSLLDGDDTQLEAIYNSLNSLREFIDPEKYKTYSDLKTRLVRVLGDEAARYMSVEDTITIEDSRPAPAPRKVEQVVESVEDGEDDDTLSYFKKLASS